MKFNANDLKKAALPEEGLYKFKVIYAYEKTSTNGNDMLNLKLDIYINNKPVRIFDNLMLIPSMFWKLEHFCSSVGIKLNEEDNEILAQDLDNKEGYLIISHQINKETGEYQARVKDYVIPEAKETETETNFDDDIPNFV